MYRAFKTAVKLWETRRSVKNAPACGRKSFPVFLGKELTTDEDEEALQVRSTPARK